MVLSDALCLAARSGDVAAIRAWLEAGGNPDERTGPDTVDLHRPHEIGQTLLHHAVGRVEYRWAGEQSADVENRRDDVVRMLLAHGATVDALPERINNTPLFIAALRGRTEAVEQLCLAGANVNHKRQSGDFPLWHATDCPATVRVLLRFGADPSMTYCYSNSNNQITPEENANRQLVGTSYLFNDRLRESIRLLRDARLLRPRLRGVFALRALCHRGRAGPTAETPEAFARLIGGGTSRPRTRAAAKTLAPPGLPDPLAHLVCKFWLGDPPRRRRAEPATE